ncbi:hypothetical protein HRS9139_00653 [Pyrenophora teres f. teres]|nr:hypothetical protein HRS9139_00653 [Pyrenophora teres f. teres]
MLQRRLSPISLRYMCGRKSVLNCFNPYGIRHIATTVVPREKGTTTQTQAQLRSQYPLSIMPTDMLLRSLFIATVSSNKFLLTPALHLLSFFSKPGRSYLFNVERNPVLKAILKRSLYNQFCAGETEQETKACVKQLKDLGFKGVILTYAKEMVFDHNTELADQHASAKFLDDKSIVTQDTDIEAWKQGTLGTLNLISEGDILAIKTTGAGPAVATAFSKGELPPQQMLDTLEEIATKCKERGVQIIVDAESQKWQKGIARMALELMRKFNRGGKAVIYNTYQCYLKETPAVVEQHLAEAEKDGFTLGLKLVRGAYMLSDDRSLIHDTKEDTDNAYNSLAQGALRQQIGPFGATGPHAKPFPPVNLFIASHNRESVLSANKLHRQRLEAGLPTVPVAYGQLHGMSDEVSFSLLAEKGEGGKAPEVLKCTTWGSMGNLGTSILKSLIKVPTGSPARFDRFAACVQSDTSKQRLEALSKDSEEYGDFSVFRGANVPAVEGADIVILGVDPSQVEVTLREEGMSQALVGKLLISVVAGWSRERLESLIYAELSEEEAKDIWVLRTLPNVAAQVSQSLTAIEEPARDFPPAFMDVANEIFSHIGKPVHIAPRLMAATTAVGGSTPAFWSIICDAFIDAAVAVGLPRPIAQAQIYQSMRGTAEMLQSGIQPGELRDMGTSPEGCTIGASWYWRRWVSEERWERR